MKGIITKLVRTHGSAWGRVRADGATNEAFFNPHSFTSPSDFDLAEVGQAVDFVEETDRVNGAKASSLTLSADAPQEAAVANG